MDIINKVSECEEMTMSVIWDATHDLALEEVMNEVNRRYGKTWKPQTVSTFLTRLRTKGFLNMYRKGRYAYYQPLVTKEEYCQYELLIMAERFYGGNLGMLARETAKLDNTKCGFTAEIL